ncbi:Wzz/FepE/Etk N-terminal domain-containing protein [Chromobacterium vaccinii]|uniref:GumC family protein n=1 Tax=Chromobacterium vaccinii TaxID=1108595 RepID=UPI001E350258|nr:Wzz/FepE/Etk N-terminal domain-containing protein [Chromobacterium vaccinii]MCD4485087.1 Wzz/FepE/Etk N-terminal domain-containing protein [Chromobacterium vaccinii]
MTSPTNTQTGGEIDLLALLSTLQKYKFWIIISTVLFSSVALTYCLLAKPVFTASSSIMPPQQQNSGMSALLGQLGGLASMAGAGGISGLKNPNDLYIGMLQSRIVADRLIRRFQLKERYEQETLDGTRRVLKSRTAIINGKDGLININVDDPDPRFAAQLANAYIDELKQLNQVLAMTDAAKRRLFFEQQLKQAKEQLTSAETALRQTQEKTGLIQPEGQLPAIVGSVTQLRASIAAKEVQLEAMRSYATQQNPLYIRTEQELSGLHEQLKKLETGNEGRGDLMVPTGKVAQSGLEYLRRLREVKYQETIFELLAKQYELAKIDEAKDSSLIQVLDNAVPPELKSKPSRSLIMAIGLLLGFLFGVFGSFLHAKLFDRQALKRPEPAHALALRNEH